MTELLALPSSLRLVMFVAYSLAAATLLYCAIYNVMTKRDRLFIVYLFSLFFSLVVMLVTRTPLLSNENVLAAECAHLVIVVPMALAIVCMVKDKRYILIADAVWCLLCLPFLSVIPYYAYISAGSFVYLAARLVSIVSATLTDVVRFPGRLSIKYALDDAPDGIAFVNLFSRITYINTKMRVVLDDIGVSSYENAVNIISTIKRQAASDGRKISDCSYIVNVGDTAYRFAFDNPLTQISCVDVSEEERLVKETENNKILLKQANDDLADALKTIDNIQKENELLAVKGRIHDDLAQRLSILHMFILNDHSGDLRRIKDMLSSLEITSVTPSPASTPSDLVNLLKSIGVTLQVDGEPWQDERVRTFAYKLLKETSTNAIKHGKASYIHATFSSTDEDWCAVVENNGLTAQSLHFGNGLNSLQNEAMTLGGKLTVDSSPIFTISVQIKKT